MCDLLPAYSVARSKVSADTSNTARNRYLLGTCSQNIAGDSSDGDVTLTIVRGNTIVANIKSASF